MVKIRYKDGTSEGIKEDCLFTISKGANGSNLCYEVLTYMNLDTIKSIRVRKG